jgi:hypothetical protein
MVLGKKYKRGETIRTPLEFYENGRFIRCKVEAPSATFERTYFWCAKQITESIELCTGT